jgi:peptide/nickel transport system substrate-binding protein/oligopeptide transport system substrate-binding protein
MHPAERHSRPAGRSGRARWWPPRAALAVALVIVAVTAACGGSASQNGSTSAASDSPRQGGSLTFAFQGEPSTLDPAVAWDIIGTQVEHQIYRGVLGYAPKSGAAGLEMVPDLATEVPSVENGGVTNGGKRFTFHLRKGVMFQAPVSREVTAQDFKYSFERMLREPLAPATYFYMGVVGAQEFYDKKADTVAGFKALDRYTFEIDLTSPDLSFLKAFGGMDFCDVVPREWVEKWGKQFDRHPLGTGPFVFDHWTPGREIVLTRNPDYWEQGKPYLDEVKYALSFNPQTAFLKLQRGQVDVLMDYLPTPDIARAKADPALSRSITTMTKMATEYPFMNTQMKPFDDIKVRQALSWAIDREGLVKLLGGQAEALYQVYPRSMPGHEEGKAFFGYDPAKARQLLAAAGHPDGFKTTIYSSNVDPYPKLMQSVQADLAEVGVKAALKTTSVSTYGALSSTPHTTPMGTETWSMDFPDPADWIIPIFSKSNAVQGGVNAAFWWTPELEQMIVDAQALTDPAARITKYTSMQDYIMSQAPYITLYQPIKITVCSANVGGFYLHQAYQWDTIDYWRM